LVEFEDPSAQGNRTVKNQAAATHWRILKQIDRRSARQWFVKPAGLGKIMQSQVTK